MIEMTQLAEDKFTHLSNYSRFEEQAMSDSPSWLDELRKSAIARFDQVGFPTTKQEDWRFTNVAPIARTPFVLADAIDNDRHAEKATDFTFGKDAACELVFINGHYSSRLSKLGKLPRGV